MSQDPAKGRRMEKVMTEAEWLECTAPMSMSEFLRGSVRERKSRLFACACCRRFSHLLDDRSLRAIAVAEADCDEPRPAQEMDSARAEAEVAFGDTYHRHLGNAQRVSG